MTLQQDITALGTADVIKLAVLAVGGQGGGVLTNWIADLAKRGGYAVQMTSVAGVAQRTGATIYYVEMAPQSDRLPVFALAPSQGDLDILIASELMEAGRAVLRGFVTPDRTTLIASSHRILAVSEKEVPGDGRAEATIVSDEIEKAALKTVCFDMEQIAAATGSKISASLFGALARSKALPFENTLFEEVIKASGRGVDQSIAAFRGALHYDETPPAAAPAKPNATAPKGPAALVAKWDALVDRIQDLPAPSRDMALAGLRKTVDYQDVAYGAEYLDHLDRWVALDRPDRSFALTTTAAKYIANAMCYDDILRVADLKTRASRNTRLRSEQQASADQIVHVTEYFHPRMQEVCGTLPAGLGQWIEDRPRLFNTLQKLVDKGRRVRTDGIIGFTTLWAVSAMKPRRRKTLRHQHEATHLNHLIDTAANIAPDNYELAIGVLNCQRLVKGYSDTHARGHSKFSKVLGALDTLKTRKDAADWVRRLREAALQDEDGTALDGALATIASFAKGSQTS
jgi:indolepyruvate ferredoxin oxidoreductase beta subunit